MTQVVIVTDEGNETYELSTAEGFFTFVRNCIGGMVLTLSNSKLSIQTKTAKYYFYGSGKELKLIIETLKEFRSYFKFADGSDRYLDNVKTTYYMLGIHPLDLKKDRNIVINFLKSQGSLFTIDKMQRARRLDNLFDMVREVYK